MLPLLIRKTFHVNHLTLAAVIDVGHVVDVVEAEEANLVMATPTAMAMVMISAMARLLLAIAAVMAMTGGGPRLLRFWRRQGQGQGYSDCSDTVSWRRSTRASRIRWGQ